jgi:hypothetical protein
MNRIIPLLAANVLVIVLFAWVALDKAADVSIGARTIASLLTGLFVYNTLLVLDLMALVAVIQHKLMSVMNYLQK